MRINPAAFLIQPDIKKTLITPARGCGLAHLLSRILLRNSLGVVSSSLFSAAARMTCSRKIGPSNHQCPKSSASNGTVIIGFQSSACTTLQFGDASLHKMMGMPAGRLFRGRTIINLFHRNVAAGNAMIFNSGKLPFGKGASSSAINRSRYRDRNRDKPDRQDNLVARSKPDGWREYLRAKAAGPALVKHGAKLPRRAGGSACSSAWASTMNQRIFSACNDSAMPVGVSTFRQPKPGRFAAECFAKLIASDCDLRIRSPRRLLQNRKNRVRRCTGHYFNRASSTKLPKNSKQIAIPFLEQRFAVFPQKIRDKTPRATNTLFSARLRSHSRSANAIKQSRCLM